MIIEARSSSYQQVSKVTQDDLLIWLTTNIFATPKQ